MKREGTPYVIAILVERENITEFSLSIAFINKLHVRSEILKCKYLEIALHCSQLGI